MEIIIKEIIGKLKRDTRKIKIKKLDVKKTCLRTEQLNTILSLKTLNRLVLSILKIIKLKIYELLKTIRLLY
jgi:hypothetical protein